MSGVYAWYFDDVPPHVPTGDCHSWDGALLLYVGISPRKPTMDGRASRQSLRSRLRYHYRGNAAGSTLRLTLGCLLETSLGIQLQAVGSRNRLTFAGGEDALSRWMSTHARVTWLADPEPWVIEDQLIESLSLPLNLQGNSHHPFQPTLSGIRAAARNQARTPL